MLASGENEIWKTHGWRFQMNWPARWSGRAAPPPSTTALALPLEITFSSGALEVRPDPLHRHVPVRRRSLGPDCVHHHAVFLSAVALCAVWLQPAAPALSTLSTRCVTNKAARRAELPACPTTNDLRVWWTAAVFRIITP